ncbi:MAG: GNAT family N-acetyltransferase [Ktedonobacterales bacterium]|jgi:mycothiol synthase
MTQQDAVSLPTDYTVRAALDQDPQDILRLMEACYEDFGLAWGGYTEVDVRDGWAHLDMQRDTWCILAPDGALAAYAELTSQGSGTLRADGYVHPAHRGKGVGTDIVRLMEARGRELASEAPAGSEVSLFNGVMLDDQAGRDLLEREGYSVVRVFWEMRIELSEEPAAPSLPAGLRLRGFIPGQDDHAVYETNEAAFADHWEHAPRTFEEWREGMERPDFDPALWLLIEAEDGTIPAILRSWMRSEQGYISTVGTLRAWRGRGLASALLRASFRVYWQRGVQVVALHVDAQNPTGATRVYEAAGMHTSASAVIYKKSLRPGDNVATEETDPTQA